LPLTTGWVNDMNGKISHRRVPNKTEPIRHGGVMAIVKDSFDSTAPMGDVSYRRQAL
jgi:hypothetical protein